MAAEGTETSPKVTIGIVNYNGKHILAETLDAVKALNDPTIAIAVADNASTDGSHEWLQENHPNIHCLSLGENRGPAGARNAILQAYQSPYILFLDNDITVHHDTLSRLLKVMEAIPDIAACHPEICDPHDDQVHHYNGGYFHYLGAYISRDPPEADRPEFELFDMVSGAALLVSREAALDVGGFDEDYFFNWEDGDFAARLTLSGYLCANVPAAVVLHRSKARGTSKAYYMVRNRWFFLLKLYNWKTLILLSPALLIFELAQATLLLAKGSFGDYLKGNLDALRAWPEILEKRSAVQKLKQKRDRDWLHSDNVYISQNVVQTQSLVSILSRFLFRVFDGYWAIVSRFC